MGIKRNIFSGGKDERLKEEKQIYIFNATRDLMVK